MNPLALLGSANGILSLLGSAVHLFPVVIHSVSTTMTAVENTEKSGEEKLVAVLNSVGEIAAAIFPAESTEITAFMVEIERFVEATVDLWNHAEKVLPHQGASATAAK